MSKNISHSQRPSKKVVKQCREIHNIIDDLLPGVYAEEIQRRLANRGIDEPLERIYNARRLTIKSLPIMEEFLAYCTELYPEESLKLQSDQLDTR